MKTQLLLPTILLFAFATANTFGQIPNSGFENWTTIGGSLEPDDWGTPNDACNGPYYRITKSTDNYPVSIGTYSMRLENNTSLLPSYCAYGFTQTQQGTNGTTQFPITGHPTSLTGYYKFIPLNGDTMRIIALLYNGGTVTSIGEFSTTVAAPTWTSFSIPFQTYITADSAQINLAACYITTVPHGNSVLYVDNLNFDALITGISDIDEENRISVYPNPTSEKLTITFPTNNSKQTDLKIFNTFGQQVFNQLISNSTGTTTLDISQFAVGIYFIRATTDKQTVYDKKIIIAK